MGPYNGRLAVFSVSQVATTKIFETPTCRRFGYFPVSIRVKYLVNSGYRLCMPLSGAVLKKSIVDGCFGSQSQSALQILLSRFFIIIFSASVSLLKV